MAFSSPTPLYRTSPNTMVDQIYSFLSPNDFYALFPQSHLYCSRFSCCRCGKMLDHSISLVSKAFLSLVADIIGVTYCLAVISTNTNIRYVSLFVLFISLQILTLALKLISFLVLATTMVHQRRISTHIAWHLCHCLLV